MENIGKSWLTVHEINAEDAAVIAQVRTMAAPIKGVMKGIEARPAFDGIMSHVPAPDEVTFEADTVGGIAGWWARPAEVQTSGVVLYFHGGWYSWGSATAYKNFVGHIALSAGAAAFVPEYRLAPESPFPAAVVDAEAVYNGLVDSGATSIGLVGDSAGGGLSLSLLSVLAKKSAALMPVGAVAFSPVTDMALTGESWRTRAEADPYFTLGQGEFQAKEYLGDHNPEDPMASPLYADLSGLPPIRVQVGDDELLLDDSIRYVEKAAAAGVDARLDLWMGLPHVFQSSVGGLAAAGEALRMVGEFLRARL